MSTCRDVATGGGGECEKLKQKSGKIQVKILTFSGKICVIKVNYLFANLL